MARPAGVVLLVSLAAVMACAATVPALAFTSPCTALGSPQDQPPCPVMDNPHNAQEQPRVQLEQTILDKHTDSKKQESNQNDATGQQGSSGQGGPQAGGDLTGGQAMSSLQTMGQLNGANAQFYFGDNSNVTSQAIQGAQPSNFTTAAESSSTADVAATIFAIQAKKQVEQASKEVAQMASQASQTTTSRADLGFANKVRAKLVEELQLRAALEARLVEIRAKRAAFHTLADQTKDVARGNLAKSTSGDTPTILTSSAQSTNVASAAVPTDSPGTAASTPTVVQAQTAAQAQAAAQALAASRAAAASAAVVATPATVDPLTAASLSAQAQLSASLAGASTNPAGSAASLLSAYGALSGDQADKLRQIGVQLAEQPANFGITGQVDDTALLTTLATYGSSTN